MTTRTYIATSHDAARDLLIGDAPRAPSSTASSRASDSSGRSSPPAPPTSPIGATHSTKPPPTACSYGYTTRPGSPYPTRRAEQAGVGNVDVRHA